MKSIVVFCGSSEGNDPIILESAVELGQTLASRNMTLVYGAAKIGVMGKLAEGALDTNGKVIGVIPDFLMLKEVYHPELTELIVTKNMQERKLKMHELSDGIITLPGGYGTLEELFEMITWAQLGMHAKPCGLLNVGNYYGQLLAFLDHAVQEMFIYAPHREMILSAVDPSDLIDQMTAYDKAPINKAAWVHSMEKNHGS